ncbi:hypothetical protein SETIT_J025800v2 [Setaria italica]|uniref:Uncharacterized protein n=1 Tax=Setaria italica TaxID=4555 RepID=K3Z293_SETIT|nr:hypothetical protein SETIT_J025800v2 [Setaria italica]
MFARQEAQRPRSKGGGPIHTKEKCSASTATHPQALILSRVSTNEANTMELNLSQLISCPDRIHTVLAS